MVLTCSNTETKCKQWCRPAPAMHIHTHTRARKHRYTHTSVIILPLFCRDPLLNWAQLRHSDLIGAERTENLPHVRLPVDAHQQLPSLQHTIDSTLHCISHTLTIWHLGLFTSGKAAQWPEKEFLKTKLTDTVSFLTVLSFSHSQMLTIYCICFVRRTI